jgi:hypothetical protein
MLSSEERETMKEKKRKEKGLAGFYMQNIWLVRRFKKSVGKWQIQ